MVHKHKSFPVGKTGQKRVKKQVVDQEELKPIANADLGIKLATLTFVSMLGIAAKEQSSKKGGRRRTIDPLQLKRLADNILRDIESREVNEEGTSSEEGSEDSNISASV